MDVNNLKVKIEFDLDEIYVDEFLPIFHQPILKVIQDIKRAERLIEEKVAEDVRTSDNFKKLKYDQLEEEIISWANRNKDRYKKLFPNGEE